MTQEFIRHLIAFLEIRLQQVMRKKVRLAKIVICSIILLDCSSNRESLEGPSVVGEEATMSTEVLGKWNRSCALCHVNGEADAPIIGDTKIWSERLRKGEDVLIKSVVEGLKSMPPLGYCMACEIDDFKSMISFMVGKNLRISN